jgi:hypothetical protein
VFATVRLRAQSSLFLGPFVRSAHGSVPAWCHPLWVMDGRGYATRPPGEHSTLSSAAIDRSSVIWNPEFSHSSIYARDPYVVSRVSPSRDTSEPTLRGLRDSANQRAFSSFNWIGEHIGYNTQETTGGLAHSTEHGRTEPSMRPGDFFELLKLL